MPSFVPHQKRPENRLVLASCHLEIASKLVPQPNQETPYGLKVPPPKSSVATLHNIKAVFPQFDAIIKERTTVKPLYVSLPCYEYAKEFALQQVFVIRSLKSVNTNTSQAKHSVNHTKKVWKATRNHNVNTTKTAWRPTGKVVGSVKPQWKPTGRHFALYDNCPLTRIMEPIVEPLALTPSVSYSSKVSMISRFTDCKLSYRKAGSKGISGIFEC
ncbi:hypothetical protein Tco_0596024 [Tanacetum coccineum]